VEGKWTKVKFEDFEGLKKKKKEPDYGGKWKLGEVRMRQILCFSMTSTQS
jgi:hypothetical protein